MEPIKWVRSEGDITYLDLKANWVAPDRIQYKPYGPSISMQGILVRVTIPTSQVVEVIDDPVVGQTVVLSPEGLASIADSIANAFEDMHKRHQGIPTSDYDKSVATYVNQALSKSRGE